MKAFVYDMKTNIFAPNIGTEAVKGTNIASNVVSSMLSEDRQFQVLNIRLNNFASIN
eukprot:CAMPEP_0175059666 /NCGR_PEP_ID=MMETSP0052_2-20121109/12561_1 /TAXON_ID=51329 ORGANISM="Polytomella parva, Strain SAG 63-3" /NCGR_SAMPLE_ID=MMETSP0052_2 /ASSEMBLY_ACC=CAM_ASM_000194 /LENGTH=56 /DNA_ID=CAMNT_0016325245 /DNA_START=352 /DNA_END=522 /DNA_ORIENTATION=+